MSLKSCVNAGVNLSDEDVNAVLSNYDAYITTMGQNEATALAVDDALESAKQERDETREAILKAHPDLIPTEPEPEPVVEPVEAPVDPQIAKKAKAEAKALALRAPQEDGAYNIFAAHAANVARLSPSCNESASRVAAFTASAVNYPSFSVAQALRLSPRRRV